MAGVSYSELARREAELAQAEIARAENARRFALRQADNGLLEYFLRVASRCELNSGKHAERARRFEELAAREEPIATLEGAGGTVDVATAVCGSDPLARPELGT